MLLFNSIRLQIEKIIFDVELKPQYEFYAFDVVESENEVCFEVITHHSFITQPFELKEQILKF